MDITSYEFANALINSANNCKNNSQRFMYEGAKMTISNELANILIDSANECDVYLRNDYSGRFMYGATCWGVDGDYDKVEDFIYTATKKAIKAGLEDEFDDMIKAKQQDQMGLGTIVYFPNYIFDDEVTENEVFS